MTKLIKKQNQKKRNYSPYEESPADYARLLKHALCGGQADKHRKIIRDACILNICDICGKILATE